MRDFLVVSYLPDNGGLLPPKEALHFRNTLANVIPQTAYAAAEPPSFPSSSSLAPGDAIWERLPESVVGDPGVEAWGYLPDPRWDEATIHRVGKAIVDTSEFYRKGLDFKGTDHLLPWLPRFYVPRPIETP